MSKSHLFLAMTSEESLYGMRPKSPSRLSSLTMVSGVLTLATSEDPSKVTMASSLPTGRCDTSTKRASRHRFQRSSSRILCNNRKRVRINFGREMALSSVELFCFSIVLNRYKDKINFYLAMINLGSAIRAKNSRQ